MADEKENENSGNTYYDWMNMKEDWENYVSEGDPYSLCSHEFIPYLFSTKGCCKKCGRPAKLNKQGEIEWL